MSAEVLSRRLQTHQRFLVTWFSSQKLLYVVYQLHAEAEALARKRRERGIALHLHLHFLHFTDSVFYRRVYVPK